MAEVKKTEKKPVITPEIRRLWFNMRKAWSMNVTAFSNAVSSLDRAQSEKMYDIVKLALFLSFSEIRMSHPELKPILQTEDDRLCMYQIYEILSWKLGKKEKEPKDVQMVEKFKGGIGRASFDI